MLSMHPSDVLAKNQQYVTRVAPVPIIQATIIILAVMCNGTVIFETFGIQNNVNFKILWCGTYINGVF